MSHILQRLEAKKLITRDPRGTMALTVSGATIAERSIRRHRRLERFLDDQLEVPWHELHREATQLERAMLPRLEAHIAALVGDATTVLLLQQQWLAPEQDLLGFPVLQPGDPLGIVAALPHAVYPLTSQAVVPSTALRWEHAALTRLMERYPVLALRALRLIAQRFAELQQQYLELATERVERRLARALLRLVSQVGRRVPEGVLIDLPLSRQDLAAMSGTTRYTASRTLSRWEQQGIVASTRERVVIRAPHALVTIADDLPPREA